MAPIGAVLSGGSTINSLGGFSTGGPFGGGGGINGGPWDEQISIASGKGVPQWAVWDFGSTANSDSGGLQQIGFWEGLIPIWGSGKRAYYDVKRGCYQGAVFNGALAVSDVALVKSAGGALARGAWKFGGTSWSTVRDWYGATRALEVGQPVHHWLIPQGQWGKSIPTWIKNQPWNLLPIEPPKGGPFSAKQWHDLLEGKTLRKGDLYGTTMNRFDRFRYGTPGWAQNVLGNAVGKLGAGMDWIECSGGK